MDASRLYLPDMKVVIKYVAFAALFFLVSFFSNAQDTLPKFTVQNKGGGRIVVSWKNPYPNLIQLAVQRSYDSLKRFSTVYSTTSPELPVNGFSDKVPEGLRVFYRVFYVMEGGAYYFTQSKQPAMMEDIPVTKVDTSREVLSTELKSVAEAPTRTELKKDMYDPNKPLYLKENDSTVFRILLLKDFRSYRDSIVNLTKDTLIQIGEDTILIKVYDPPFASKASQYIFTDKDGYITIKLMDAATKKYQVTFMAEDETPLLEIKQVKDPLIILDKTNFYKGGWYKYTLKENGRVKEKGRVFLPKDF